MSDPYILPTGNLTGYTVQIENDVSDIPPHTFLVITDPNGVSYGYGFAPSTTDAPYAPGEIFDNTGHPFNTTSGPIALTADQYNSLSQFINNSITNPPYYNVAQGQECTAWAVQALNVADVVQSNLPPGETGNIALGIFETLTYNPYNGWLQQNYAAIDSAVSENLTILGQYGQNILQNLFSNISGQQVINNSDGSSAVIESNSNGGTISFYDPTQSQVSNLEYFLNPNTSSVCTIDNPDGSGSVISNGQIINYAAGETPSITTEINTAQIIFTPNSGTGASETVDLSANGMTAAVGGTSFSETLANTQAAINAQGDISFVTGSGSSADTLTVAGNGSGINFSSSAGNLNFGAGSLQSVGTDSSGNIDFGLSSPVTGASEGLVFNPTTSSATLDLTISGSQISAPLEVLPTGDSMSVNGTTFNTFNTAGQQIAGTSVNPDGSYNSTIINADNTAVYNYNAFGQLTSSTTTYTAGGYSNTIYSTDASNPWQSQTSIYNANGQQIGTAIINTDGSATLETLDPSSGNAILTTNLNNQGQIAQLTAAQNVDYPSYVQAIADTFATQIISNVLIKNNLPGSIAAQAFATATIQSALAPPTANTTFAQYLAQSTFDIAGGIAGSDVGGLVAKALDLPPQLGTLTGGVIGNLVTQSLVNEAAQALNLTTSATDALSPLSLAGNLAAAGGAAVGSILASMIEPPTTTGEITGAVATVTAVSLLTDAVAFTNPVTAAIDIFAVAFGSNFLGNLLGSLFGGGESVGQDAVSQNSWNSSTGQFFIAASGADNGGTTDVVNDMGTTLNGVMNQVMTAIGGTLVNPQDMSLVWFKGNYYFAFGDQSPRAFPNESSDPGTIVQEAAFTWLKSLQIDNGNPYMVYALQHSDATDLTGLLSDLNAAGQFGTYVANPVAFDLALAQSGDPNQLATWEANLARMNQLGLYDVGSGQTFNISNVTVYMDGTATTATVAADNDTVYLTENASLTVSGTSNGVFAATGDTLTVNGGTSNHVFVYGNNITATDTNSGDTAWIAYDGNVLNISNATVYINNGPTINDGPINNTIVGDGNTIHVGDYDVSNSLTGTGDTIYAAYGSFTLNAGVTNADFYGTGETIDAANGVSFTLFNPNNMSNTVNASDGTLTLGSNVTVTFTGDNETINAVSGDTLTLHGTGDMLTASGVTVNLGTDVTGLTIGGSDNSIVAAGADTVTINGGSGNHVYAYGTNGTVIDTNSGDTAWMAYSGNTLEISNATVYINNDTTMQTVDGNTDTIHLGDYDTANSLTGLNDIVYGAYGSFILNAGVTNADFYGTGETIDAANGVSFTLFNPNNMSNTVNASDGTLTLASNVTATITANDETINATSGDTFTLNGTNDSINASGITANLGANVTGLTVTGSNDLVVAGTANTVTVGGGSSDHVQLYGNNVTLTDTNSGDTAWIAYTGNELNISNATVYINNGATNNTVDGTVDTIHVGDYDTYVNVIGANNTIYAAYGSVFLDPGVTNAMIYGNGEIINVAPGDTYSVSGPNNTVITDTIISASNGSTINNFNGTNDLIDIPGLAYDSTITATPDLNSGGTSGQLVVADNGVTVDTITLNSIQSIGSFNVRPDGTGGTLLIDPSSPDNNSAPHHDEGHHSDASYQAFLEGMRRGFQNPHHDEKIDFRQIDHSLHIPALAGGADAGHQAFADSTLRLLNLPHDEFSDYGHHLVASPHTLADHDPNIHAMTQAHHSLALFSQYAAAMTSDAPLIGVNYHEPQHPLQHEAMLAAAHYHL